MKLIRVDAYEVVVPARPGRVNSEEYGPPIWDMIPKLVVEFHTDDGLVGLGEGPRSSGETTLRSACAQLAGRDLRALCFQEPPLLDLSSHDMFAVANPRRPHRLLERNFNNYDHLAVHVALLDLLGKHTGLPLCALMGGAYRERVAVDTWMGRMTPQDSARICREAQALGFHGAKMKCALEDDNVARAQAIRDACGEQFKLTFDPNHRFYRFAEAAPLVRQLAAVGNLGCVEDPFPKGDLEAYRMLRQLALAPIALHLPYDSILIEAIRTHACDFVNLGGTPWDIKRGGEVCWLAGIPTWHGSGVDLGILEACYLHTAAATKSMWRPCDIFGRTIREHNLITNPMIAQDGSMPVPAGPGLGVELDRDALDRYTKRRFSFNVSG
ncbi:mandelate racemase/muconate lactonizing enzyme family protein [Fontivita pretiosa]|uniref:mandelate racemase/muconate lactonizing enzyme family protein n=1 Tax=Fontivita pretiosa TaxID=2989684 RepID=UPI003D171DBB